MYRWFYSHSSSRWSLDSVQVQACSAHVNSLSSSLAWESTLLFTLSGPSVCHPNRSPSPAHLWVQTEANTSEPVSLTPSINVITGNPGSQGKILILTTRKRANNILTSRPWTWLCSVDMWACLMVKPAVQWMGVFTVESIYTLSGNGGDGWIPAGWQLESLWLGATIQSGWHCIRIHGGSKLKVNFAHCCLHFQNIRSSIKIQRNKVDNRPKHCSSLWSSHSYVCSICNEWM